METIENLSKKSKSNDGFFSTVFSFDEDFKERFLNINQYTFLSIIPVILLSKLIKRFSPEPDYEKGSLEILFEIIAQLLTFITGLFFINRIICYIPTYSEVPYDVFPISASLSILYILVSFQTTLAEKINILLERIEKLWNGDSENNNKKKNKGKQNVKVSQPISNQGQMQPNNIIIGQDTISGTTSLNNLPQNNGNNNNNNSQSSPNFNDFYANQDNPLVGASSPGGLSEGFASDILPANSVLGGAFGSAF